MLFETIRSPQRTVVIRGDAVCFVCRCVRSLVHEGWSYSTGANDIALCVLDSPSALPSVTLMPPGGSHTMHVFVRSCTVQRARVGWQFPLLDKFCQASPLHTSKHCLDLTAHFEKYTPSVLQ